MRQYGGHHSISSLFEYLMVRGLVGPIGVGLNSEVIYIGLDIPSEVIYIDLGLPFLVIYMHA